MVDWWTSTLIGADPRCVVDTVGKEYRFCGMGDLNECIGDTMRVDMTGVFVVPRRN